MRRIWLLLCLLLFSTLSWAGYAPVHTLTLGVFAYRPAELMQQHYQPLAEYLDEALGEELKLELRILDYQQMEEALRHNQLDFVLTNPSHYLILRSQTTMTGVLATLVRNEQGVATSALGGVILVPEDSSIETLKDLKGKRIAIAGSRFLGGFQTQMYELQQLGIEERHLQFSIHHHHDGVLKAVLAGEVDAGFVRSGILEDWQQHELGTAAHLRVINEQSLLGYPFRVSTRLYPEWPLLAMPHLDQRMVRRVASALMELTPEHPAAQAAEIEGFMPAADYSVVEQMARSLRMPPYDHIEPIDIYDLWQQYRAWILAIAALLLGLLLSLSWSARQAWRLRQQRAALAQERQCLSDVIWGADVGTWEWNVQSGETRFNDRWAQMLGYTLAELEPVSIDTWAGVLHPDDQAKSAAALQACFERISPIYECEVRVRHKQGHWLWILDRGRVLEWDEAGKPVRMSGTHLDITDRREAQEGLRRMAYYDALTQLPNRVLLTDRLERAMANVRRHGHHLALVYLDLDGFKAVNDSHGHAIGDQLLIEVAGRMQAALRETDTLARIGGDEFVMLVGDLERPEACEPVLERVLVAASDPVSIKGLSLRVSASMGVVYYPRVDDSAERLLRHADQAMYQAKSAGKNRYHIFTPEVQAEVQA